MTGPVSTPPPDQPAVPPAPPQTVYVQQPPSRLNKAAAWVGIAAGSVFIVAVIFGAGFLVGKNVGDGPRHHHSGIEMSGPAGPVMFPMGPPGGFERGPGFAGPFGPGGPMIEVPRQPGGPSTPTPGAPPRP